MCECGNRFYCSLYKYESASSNIVIVILSSVKKIVDT